MSNDRNYKLAQKFSQFSGSSMPPRGGAPQMPQVGKNLYNQGLSTGANSSGVYYPDTIPCTVCKKEKGHDAYSKRQLLNWRNSIYQPWAPAGRVTGDPRPTCKLCTANQTTELTCCVCSETKGLDKFSKAQRKCPDRARCKNCIDFHGGVEPDLEMPDSDDYASSEEEGDFDIDATSPTGKAAVKKPVGPLRAQDLDIGNLSVRDESDQWETLSKAGSTMTAARSTKGSVKGSFAYAASSKPASSYAGSNYGGFGRPAERKENKAGWAKVRKVQQKNTSDNDDDEDEKWATPKRKAKKTDLPADPWDNIYK